MQACNLSAHDIACRRGDRIVFRAVSLTMGQGDALHIRGANGCGKTSLIRILCGLLKPYAGAITRIGAAGLLDENPALDPQWALGRALLYWQRLDQPMASKKQAAIQCEENAFLLGLDALMDVPFRFLSTGQRKRAAIARLMGQNAPIWLLDEPLNGLDQEAIAQVEGLIALHRQSGGICVTASHQPIQMEGAGEMLLENYRAQGDNFEDGDWAGGEESGSGATSGAPSKTTTGATSEATSSKASGASSAATSGTGPSAKASFPQEGSAQ